MSREQKIRDDYKTLIVETGLEMVRLGITVGTWGNISVRDPDTDYMYISPSGMDYTAIQPRHVVVMDLDLNVVDGTAEPSVEKHMHGAVYRHRKDVHAVVHTHPTWSSVFGVIRQPLPAVSEDFAQIVGAEITYCDRYELPGTPELGQAAIEALGGNNAVLLPNHGALSVGRDMRFALKVAMVLEKNAQIYLFARLLGEPVLFKDEDVETMQRFVRDHYGKRNSVD